VPAEAVPKRHVIVRLQRIHNRIKSGRCPSIHQLAEELEVSRRTVERDIEYLRDFFYAPIVYDHTRRGYRYENPDFSLDAPALKLTEGEFVAVFVAHRLLSEVKGFPGRELCVRAMTKLAALLPSAIPERAEEIDKVISFAVPGLRGDESKVEHLCARICEAIQLRRTIQVDYYSASRKKENSRCIDPYHLRYYQGAWYLVGYCHTRGEVRIFAVDRIRALDITDRTFEPQPGFSLERYFGNVWRLERGEPLAAVVWFDADVAQYIKERQWHPTQQITENEDGSVTASYQVDGSGEFKRWLLGFGSRAKALKPPELVDEMKQEAAKMLELYMQSD